ncbi:multicopper oxidase family protein [Geodermatophilus sp. URMC 64]
MADDTLSRRDVLKLSAVGATVLAIPFAPSLRAAQSSELPRNLMPRPYVPHGMDEFVPPVLGPSGTVPDEVDPTAPPRDLFVVEQGAFTAQLVPDIDTQMWGYNGHFPGPTIKVSRNQRVTVRQINNMPENHPIFGYRFTTSTHLHGSPSLPQYDGYANDTSDPGQFKDYLYDNTEDARTLWYHDHAVHHTANNVYTGLAAQYHLEDPLAPDQRFPRGEFDIPLIISDVALDGDGQLLFDDRSQSGPMGDIILVNGLPWPEITVQPRRYRFRILGASVARSYLLSLTNGLQMKVIATDGGLLPTPPTVSRLKLGMAERYDVVIDFAGLQGRRFEVLNGRLPNNVDFDNTGKVMRFVVAGGTVTDDSSPVPATLQVSPETRDLMALTPNGLPVRRLRFERQNGEWTINGHTWEEVEASGFTDFIADPGLGATEVWELQNNSGGWFHPIHIHLVDFKVVDRNGRPPAPYEQGPKDVVYLGEGERIRLIMRFGPHDGRYMMHCHNTSHEDHDMMFQFWVRSADGSLDGPDPRLAAPPRSNTEIGL